MIEYVQETIREISDSRRARLIVQEYIQARILEGLQEAGVFSAWAFLGGTALRFLYQLPRFSEDLDFSLRSALSPNEQDIYNDQFEKIIRSIQSVFRREDYSVDSKLHVSGPVKSAFVKFPGLLYRLGLSPHTEETVSVKVELDSRPPEGAQFDTSIIRKHSILHLQHYDKASLLAGKLHAILNRKYTKGRDLYDLLWYLSDPQWPSPNITLLRNALEQTGWKDALPNDQNWSSVVQEKLEQTDWKAAVSDVEPFLEKPSEVAMLKQEIFEKLLDEFAK